MKPFIVNQKIQFADGSIEIHASGLISDYTLCGHDTAGDENLGWDMSERTREGITCSDCERIINFCKKNRFNMQKVKI